MPLDAPPLILNYQIRDPDTGTIIIAELPHLHQSSWTRWLLLPNNTGSQVVGQFTIPLHSPYSDQGRAAMPTYALITKGLRIEGFLGPVGAGTPYVAGYITSPPNGDMTGYQIAGYDTWFVVDNSYWFPGEQVPAGSVAGSPTTADILIVKATRLAESVYDKAVVDLTGWTQKTAAAWTVSTDPVWGIPALSLTAPAAAGADSNYVIDGSTPAAFVGGFQNCRVDGWFYMPRSQSATNAGTCGLVFASDANGDNCWTATVGSTYNAGTATYTVNGAINQRAGAADTVKAVAQIWTGLPAGSAQRLQITLVSTVSDTAAAAGTVTFKLYVNGQFVVSYLFASGAFFGPTGKMGFLGYVDSATAAGFSLQASRMSWRQRAVSGYALTTGGGTPVANGATIPANSSLEVIQQVAANDNRQMQMTPGAGAWSADSLLYAPSAGTDLSGSVVFEEGTNLAAVTVEDAAELFSRDVTVASLPGMDTGGTFTWPAVLTNGQLAIMDTVGATTQGSAGAQAGMARSLQALKAPSPLPTTATVIRLPGDTWREGDTVTVNAPTFNINRQALQIVGMEFKEGTPEYTVHLGSVPQSRLGMAMRAQANSRQVYRASSIRPTG